MGKSDRPGVFSYARTVAAYSVYHGAFAADGKTVMARKMFLHTVDESAVGANGLAAFCAFKVEMVAVTSDISVQSTFSS